MKKILLYCQLLLLTKIACIEVAFDIKPNKNYCIGEFLTEDTVVIISIKTKSKKLSYELRDPKGTVIYSKKSQTEIRVSLTTVESGNYEMCVKNNDKKIVKIDYELLSGIQAQDSSQFAKESSIEPAEATIINLKNVTKDLIKEMKKLYS